MYYPNNNLSNEITPQEGVFLIEAKPYIRNVNPYIIKLNPPQLSSIGLPQITTYGKNFFTLNNLYISASNPNMIDGITLYNPFSADPINPPFEAVSISSFSQTDNIISFSLPEIKESGFLDIIIQNEAGYGLLSRDSYKNNLSSYDGFIDLQLPCISGIQIIPVD
jgi:hypothetical protein